jgi:hypothetical protein
MNANNKDSPEKDLATGHNQPDAPRDDEQTADQSKIRQFLIKWVLIANTCNFALIGILVLVILPFSPLLKLPAQVQVWMCGINTLLAAALLKIVSYYFPNRQKNSLGH